MTKLTKYGRRLQQAFIAVEKGLSLRKGAVFGRVALTTFSRKFKRRTQCIDVKSRGRKPAVTASEENSLISLLTQFSSQGYALTRMDLYDAVELMCCRMPEHRQRKLPFKNLRPGRRFAQSFEARHKRRIRFGKSSPQEGKRFRCTNAENLTSYFAALEDVIKTNTKEAAERRKALCARRKEDAKEAKFVVESRARRRDREAYEHRMMFYRAAAYNAPMNMPRSLQLRRKLARQRAIVDKALANGTESLTDEQIVTEPWNKLSCDQFESEPFRGQKSNLTVGHVSKKFSKII